MRSSDKPFGRHEVIQALVWAAKRIRSGDLGVTVYLCYEPDKRVVVLKIEDRLQDEAKERIGDIYLNR